MENNWAQLGGGALSVTIGSSATCIQCQFVDNHSGHGGAIWVGDESSSIVLTNSLVYNNSADRGGGIFIRRGSAPSPHHFLPKCRGRRLHDLLSIGAELTLQPSNTMEIQPVSSEDKPLRQPVHTYLEPAELSSVGLYKFPQLTRGQ